MASPERSITPGQRGADASGRNAPGPAAVQSPTKRRKCAAQSVALLRSGNGSGATGSGPGAAGGGAGAEADAGASGAPCPAAAAPAPPTQQARPPAPPGGVVLPVHAAVLMSTSEYFKTLISSWSADRPDHPTPVLTLLVEADEVEAALAMLRYMYTGALPPAEALAPGQLLRMLRLADQYQVNRFLSACNSAIEKLPSSRLGLEEVMEVLRLPPHLLEEAGGPLRVARRRAEEQLAAMFGDLEATWFEAPRRAAFLRLPFAAVRYLLSRTETSVHSENTALVAVTDWIWAQQRQAAQAVQAAQAATRRQQQDGAAGQQPQPQQGGQPRRPQRGPRARAQSPAEGAGAQGPGPSDAEQQPAPAAAAGGLTEAQLDELFSLLRLPHLSSAFMTLLPRIAWVRRRLTPELLSGMLALVRCEGVGGRTLPLLVQRVLPSGGQRAVPRSVPDKSTLEMAWMIRRCDIQELILECRNEAAPNIESTRLFSEPAYFHAGFYWRMVFFVQKKAETRRRRLPDPDAASRGGGAGLLGGGGGAGQAVDGEGDVLGAVVDPAGAPLAARQDLALLDAAEDGADARGAAGPGGSGGGAGPSELVTVYHDFLGVTCRAVLGSEEFTPLVGLSVEFTAHRYSGLGEQVAPQVAEVPGYVAEEVPYGIYDFFRKDSLTDASCLSEFCCARDHVHLSCKITRCF